MIPKGRQFEKLVAELETACAGRDVDIRLNDRIADLETGQLREVDISLRHKMGTHEFLTVIECRDRKAKDDCRWVEELDSKRRSVGADKIVAVSHAGFGKPALKKAQVRNIELRTLSELAPDEIKAWFDTKLISVAYQSWTQTKSSIRCDATFGVETGLLDEVRWYSADGQPNPVLQRSSDGACLGLPAVFSWLYEAHFHCHPNEGVGEEPVEKKIDFEFDLGELWLHVSGGKIPVLGLSLGFEIVLKTLPLTDMKQYRDDATALVSKLDWEDEVIYQGQRVPMQITAIVKEDD